MRSKAINVLIQLVVTTVVTLALLEGLVLWSFSWPALAPLPRSLVRQLHIQVDRNVIQVMPACALYDDRVTYTLKPGTCVFANREFSNEYRINSLGVRDDETSLARPDTVMLGDSLTMGWGVEQDEAFPSLFEKATGRRTLNAGVSSYGTVRELRLFERVDRRAVVDLVIQYSDNDLRENQQFVDDPAWRTLSRDAYEKTVEDQRRALRYFPGKYALNVLAQFRSVLRSRLVAQEEVPALAATRDPETETFLSVLERTPVDLSPFRTTVVSLDSGFIEAARRLSGTSPTPWIRRMTFVDAGAATKGEGLFYVLDDHPTAAGHRAIARELARVLAARD